MTDNTKPTVATNTEFTSRGGEVLLVANGADTFHMIAGPAGPSLIFSHTDAPAIALAILKAAGVTAADPQNSNDDFFSDEVGDRYAVLWLETYAEQRATKAQAAEDEKHLNQRRDLLVQHLLGHGSLTPYRHASEPLKTAADMIIQLQDDAAKATP